MSQLGPYPEFVTPGESGMGFRGCQILGTFLGGRVTIFTRFSKRSLVAARKELLI